MNILNNHSLASLNTFGFEQLAEFFVETHSIAELIDAVQFASARNLPLLLLGGGSNIVLTKDIRGLVVRQRTSQITYQDNESGNGSVIVNCDAGVRWHDLVLDTLARSLYGIENLSLIPGDVGAAPIQNIGAYGVELCDVIDTVTALDTNTLELKSFTPEECRFAYRDSFFKSTAPGRYAIVSVALRLTRHRQVITHYAALADELERRELKQPTGKDISAAVCAIRQSKLPDPEHIGNAGSFFKNPTISAEHHEKLKQRLPELPGHRQPDQRWKIPAAWLIDSLGWKGHCDNGVCVHDRQALVLVNQGNGNGARLLELAAKIRASVREHYAIELEQEPVTL